MNSKEEEDELRNVALRNARAILGARQRAERELIAAKEALRDTAEGLQVALAAGRLGHWSWDAASGRVTLSAEASALLGIAEASTTLDRMNADVHPDDRAERARRHEEALREGRDYELQYRIVRRDGTERWLSAMARVTYDAGAVRGMSGVLQDLTETRGKADALRDSEARLRATFEQAAVGFAVFSLDGRYLETNRKLCDILGYTPKELIGSTFLELTHPDDIERSRSAMRSVLREEIPHARYEKRYVRKDGDVIWGMKTVTLLRDAAGRPDRFMGVIEDITARKEAEEALREETRMLEILNRTGSLIASELDLMALLQAVTDAATELAGAQFGAFFYNVIGADGEAFHLYALSGAPLAAFEGFGMPRNTPIFGPTFCGEGVVRSPDITKDPRYGTMKPHRGMPPGHLPVRSYLAVPVASRTKEVFGGLFLGHSATDVFTARAERLAVGVAAQAGIALDNARMYEASLRATAERQRLLESEREARQQAERMNELKDQFLSTLSHELRTPLGALLGWTRVVRTRKLPEQAMDRAMDVIERNGRALARLIDDLLDMARIQSGQVALDLAAVSLGEAVDAALATARPAAQAKDIRIESAAAPEVTLHADAGRLGQILDNLLSNAIKFTPNGGRIDVEVTPRGSAIEIAVVDNGIGIEAAFLPFAFDRFRQADASSTRNHEGLGLGLALVKRLVELHRGEVRVESEGVGRGARFTVILPLAEVP